jgi:putative membrane protein
MDTLTWIAKILIILIALLHSYFLYFEMFAWETTGRRIFGKRRDGFYKETKSLAANQGLYNGFLVAGLIWSLLIKDDLWAYNASIFFLSCVIIAGCYGAITASRKIFFVQALPAIIAFLLLFFAGK